MAEKRAAKRKVRTDPPVHGGAEVKLRLGIDEAEAVYVEGVWISPGEEAFVASDKAAELVKAGKAEEVRN